MDMKIVKLEATLPNDKLVALSFVPENRLLNVPKEVAYEKYFAEFKQAVLDELL